MNEPIITVAIPAYNHAPYIAETIESALTQGIEQVEVVVIDDASTDDTAAIAEGFSSRDSRVRVLRNPVNQGPAKASQNYLRAARGRYIAPVASDDAFAPGKLTAQLRYLEEHKDAAMVATGVAFIDERSQPITHNRHFAASLFDTKTRDRGGWLRYFFNNGNNICGSSIMLRTDIYRTEAKSEMRLMQLQDYDCWVRLALAGYGIGMLDAPLLRYRIRDKEANLSAPSPGVRARNMFELVEVLARYHALTTLGDLNLMLPDEPREVPANVPQEAFVQHRLCLHAWKLGTAPHRMFALHNWYRLLGHEEWQAGLEVLGVNPRFFAKKSAEYPLALALAQTPKGLLRRSVEKLLPTSLRNTIVRRIKNQRDT